MLTWCLPKLLWLSANLKFKTYYLKILGLAIVNCLNYGVNPKLWFTTLSQKSFLKVKSFYKKGGNLFSLREKDNLDGIWCVIESCL